MKNKVYILSQGEHIEQEDELIDKRRRSPLVKKWQVLNCLLFFEKRIICNHRWIVKYIVMCSVNQTSLQVLLNHNIFFLSWILSLTSKYLSRFLDTLKDFPQGSHLQFLWFLEIALKLVTFANKILHKLVKLGFGTST